MNRLNRVLLIFQLFISISFAQPANSSALKFTQISDRVILIAGELNNTNQLAVNSSKGIILIDTGISPAYALIMRDSLIARFKSNKFSYVINTHSHWDHVQGNQVFAESAIIGHSNCGYDMEHNKPAANIITNKIIVETPQAHGRPLPPPPPSFVLQNGRNGYSLTKPTISFSDELEIISGDITIRMMYFGKGHSISDIIIYIPEEKLLAVGDLFYKKSLPPFGSGKVLEVQRWIKTLDKVLAEKNDIKFVVPGHNEIFGRDEMIMYKDYIVKLWLGIREWVIKGKTPEEIKKEFSLKSKFPELAEKDMTNQNGNSLHNGNIDKILAQIK